MIELRLHYHIIIARYMIMYEDMIMVRLHDRMKYTIMYCGIPWYHVTGT